MAPPPLSLSTIILTLIAAFLVSAIYTTIYNLFFHSLRKFPGPRLAATTRLYEYYYELYLGGQFSTHLLSLHEKYGPIIRINPFELHIQDSAFYHNIFNFDPELDKRVYQMENLQNSASFDLHRLRRRAFDPMFSRASILKMEPQISDMVQKLCDRMNETKRTGQPINLSLWYRCLTCDIITDYCLSQSYDLMADPAKHEPFLRSFCSVFKVLLPIREISWVAWIAHNMERIPDWMQMAPSDEGMAYMKMWQNGLEPRMRAIVKGEVEKAPHQHVVMMEEYIKNDTLGPEEKTYDRLRQTVQMFVAAGLETVGFALSMATYQILIKPSVLQKLRVEISTVWPASTRDLPSWIALDKLPFLTAVLKESMRLSVGVTSRLHRINHKRPIRYKDWEIPPGTPVSMNQWFVLWDEAIFPRPKEFIPERWLEENGGREVDKWFVPFSRGSRGCIGERLAGAEMYLTLATMIHRFDMELFDTEERDVMPKYDYFVPFPERENGVRVVLK